MFMYEGKRYSLDELRKLFKTVSIPDVPDDASLELLGVQRVHQAEKTDNPTLDARKTAMLEQIHALFADAERDAHFVSSGGMDVNADADAVRNIEGLIAVMECDNTPEILFRDYGNKMRMLTLAQLRTLLIDVHAWRQALRARKWKLSALVENAATEEALDKIDVNFSDIKAGTHGND